MDEFCTLVARNLLEVTVERTGVKVEATMLCNASGPKDVCETNFRGILRKVLPCAPSSDFQ